MSVALVAEIIQAELADRLDGRKVVTRADICEVIEDFASALTPRWVVVATLGSAPNSLTVSISY